MLGSNVFVYQLGAASHSVMLLFPTFLTASSDLLEKERDAYHCIAIIVCLPSSIMQDQTQKFSKHGLIVPLWKKNENMKK